MSQMMKRPILTTPTTTSTRPNLTTIKLDMKMTLHHHHPPTTTHPTTETFRPVLGIKDNINVNLKDKYMDNIKYNIKDNIRDSIYENNI